MKFKRNNYIILLLGYLLIFISIQAVQTDMLSFNCNEAIIEGITTRVGFSARLRVKTDSGANNQYVDLKRVQGYEKNKVIKVEKINIMETNSTRMKFPKDKNGNLIDTLEFNINGNLVFHWNNIKKGYSKRITIGAVCSMIGNKKVEVENIDINLENLNIISILKVKVKKNMDFGTIIAGEKADTRESSRTPAQIEVEGVNESNVKITIPQKVEIKNSKGDSLLVNLRFREPTQLKEEGQNKSIVKKVLSKGSKYDIGKTDLIEIDGSVATRKGNEGNYKGLFTVRVEYED